MKITIITIGSRGDVQPYVALGCGLKAAGFDVSIATYDYFRNFIESYGLTIKPLRGDPKEMLGSEDGRKWVQSGQNPIQFVDAFIDLTRERLEQLMVDALDLLADADLNIYSDLGIAGYHVAEYFDTPLLETHLQPFGPTTAFPSVGVPPWVPTNGFTNKLSHWVTEQILWQPFRTQINGLRRDLLDLPPDPFLGPFGKIRQDGNPTLYAFSRHVLPKPADWESWRHITGYWFLPPPSDWQPDTALVDFINDGEPPVYIGFGSMVDENPEILVEMILRAVRDANARVILHSGWAGLTASDLPEFAYLIDSVPHEWLLPQMTAVIHHGGAGTTAAGLRSGQPSMGVPYFADQFFWSERIHKLGIGPTAGPRKGLTAEKLAHAIREAKHNQTMRKRASEMGRLIREECGVETAVDLIKQFVT